MLMNERNEEPKGVEYIVGLYLRQRVKIFKRILMKAHERKMGALL